MRDEVKSKAFVPLDDGAGGDEHSVEHLKAEVLRLRQQVQRLQSSQARDVIEQRGAERRFNDFARISADWFFEFDADLRYTYLSKTGADRGLSPEQFLGWTRQELLGERFDRNHPDGELAAMWARQPYRNVERQSDIMPGQWLRVSGEPVFADNGDFAGYRGASVDITELKQKEAALQQGAAQLRLITNALPVVITYIGADLHYQFANRLFTEFVDKPMEKIIGHSVGEVLGEREFNKLKHRMHKALQGDMVSFEVIIDCPDGVSRHFQTDYRPHFNSAGGVRGFYILGVDVTARRAMEEQLRQSQKMETIGQLTAGVAHDFNNMLAIIEGNLGLLELELDSGHEALDLVAPALRAVRRGADLTHRMLAYSRQQSLDLRAMDANQTVMGARELLQRSLAGAVGMEISQAADLWLCQADPSQLEQALLNLAINARDAMSGLEAKAGTGCLTIKTANAVLPDADPNAGWGSQPDLPPGDYVVLTVSDNGTGMTPETATKIFDPFFTTKKIGQGTGLGLSMVYGFVKQSGGDITVASTLGEGTVFGMYFPRSVEKEHFPGVDDEEAVADGNGENILLVEDDADVRDIAERILLTYGYQVTTFSQAEEALDCLSKGQRFDLLLTDVLLPGGIDGAELAIQAGRTDPAMRLLFMSGYPRDAFVRDGRMMADAPLVKKPFQGRVLINQVKNVLAAG